MVRYHLIYKILRNAVRQIDSGHIILHIAINIAVRVNIRRRNVVHRTIIAHICTPPTLHLIHENNI